MRSVLVLALSTSALALVEYLPVCQEIARAVSNASAVFYPGSGYFENDVWHWALTSYELSTCSVEPGTAADVGVVLQTLGKHRTPFAVKGGGHASNPGFSSTKGVHIAMSRFDTVMFDADAQTVKFGAGLIWDNVYEALAPHNVSVVGGRVSGVGVAGFTLGGGFSWRSSQHGLTVDTVIAYELVTPDGSTRTVTAADEDLFWALKGGGNNFGVVTHFTLQTFLQTDVWGGMLLYTGDQLDAVQDAFAKFTTFSDPKAQIITTINNVVGVPGVAQLLFYDAPTPPPGIFDAFLDTPHLISTVGTKSFLDFVKGSPSHLVSGQRLIFDTVTVRDFTPELVKAIVNESTFLGTRLPIESEYLLSYDVEPFAQNYLLNLNRTSATSAFPPVRSEGVPLNLYFAWVLPSADAQMQEAARQSVRSIQQLALGQDEAGQALPRYPNYSIYDTPLEAMFGRDGQVDRMRAVARSVDPEGVMGLAGGFKLL